MKRNLLQLTPIAKVAAAALALSSICLVAASPTESQMAVRQSMAGFWGVAQNDLTQRAEPPTSAPSTPVNPVHPIEPLRRPPPPARCYAPPPAPVAPGVQAHQSVDRETSKGQFGLELFGGLRLFNFTWGDDTVKESDGLEGRW